MLAVLASASLAFTCSSPSQAVISRKVSKQNGQLLGDKVTLAETSTPIPSPWKLSEELGIMHKSYPEIMSSIVQGSKPSFQTLKAWFHVRISLIQLAQG